MPMGEVKRPPIGMSGRSQQLGSAGSVRSEAAPLFILSTSDGRSDLALSLGVGDGDCPSGTYPRGKMRRPSAGRAPILGSESSVSSRTGTSRTAAQVEALAE